MSQVLRATMVLTILYNIILVKYIAMLRRVINFNFFISNGISNFSSKMFKYYKKLSQVNMAIKSQLIARFVY